MNQRFTKAERIRRRADFLRVQADGCKLHTPSFVSFFALPQPVSAKETAASTSAEEAMPARLGITVSRRVGGAVVRNRIKRLLREAFRRNKQSMALPEGLEWVMIARPEAAKLPYAQVERELCGAGRRILRGGVRNRLRDPGG